MNTLGYVLILTSLLLIRGLTKGRTVTQLPDDLRDAFVATVRNDQAELKAVFARTGDALEPVAGPTTTAANPLHPDPTGVPGKAPPLGKLAASTQAGYGVIHARFPGITIGGYRSGPTAQDHGKGLALDCMTMGNRQTGVDIANFLHTAMLSQDVGGWASKITYIIWDQRIFNIARSSEGWRKMANRGSNTANHKDHVHVSFRL